ncbi:hypothetical protein Zmor_019138 [Zophobas morio]|uniref:Uncharacterized protein n=1 Tax=Zophobas morio TaxID=2755281 RepID=A0AA38HJE6_9CUCU|nr:hypothetical protein Zmor_019138 [Zophobas morio]
MQNSEIYVKNPLNSSFITSTGSTNYTRKVKDLEFVGGKGVRTNIISTTSLITLNYCLRSDLDFLYVKKNELLINVKCGTCLWTTNQSTFRLWSPAAPALDIARIPSDTLSVTLPALEYIITFNKPETQGEGQDSAESDMYMYAYETRQLQQSISLIEGNTTFNFLYRAPTQISYYAEGFCSEILWIFILVN